MTEEEIKNFIYSHSSPNGCVALTRSERDELIEMIEKHCKEPISESIFIDKDTPMLPYYDQGKELHRIADALEKATSNKSTMEKNMHGGIIHWSREVQKEK